MNGNWAWRMLFPCDVRRGICAAANAFGNTAFWLACGLLVVWIALTTAAFSRDLKTKRGKEDKTAVSADMSEEKSETESVKKNGAEKILAESSAECSDGENSDAGEMRRRE